MGAYVAQEDVRHHVHEIQEDPAGILLAFRVPGLLVAPGEGEPLHAARDGLHLGGGVPMADDEMVAYGVGDPAQVQVYDVLRFYFLHAEHHGFHQGVGRGGSAGLLHAVYTCAFKGTQRPARLARGAFFPASMKTGPVIGHEVIRLDAVDSTNNYAADRLARQELRHGTAIVAMEQTAGRGQRGRQWDTAKGLDLALSVVLLPEQLAAMEQFGLAKAAALAVHDVVADCLAQAGADPSEVRIKWPNDVLVGRKKIAGILIVNELSGGLVASSIVGIGLNVNSRGWPQEHGATSVALATGRPQDLDGVLGRLCGRMEHWWCTLLQAPARVAAAYTACLWARDRFCNFTLDGEPFNARPLDVDGTGRLLVETADGVVAAYHLDRLRFQR